MTERFPLSLSIFYNETDLAWVGRARSFLTSEPQTIFTIPLHLTQERYGGVKRTYIQCKSDNAIPFGLQNMIKEALQCGMIIDIDTDYSPFYYFQSEFVQHIMHIDKDIY